MRTRIYIDGFNLYFGSLKKTPHKWLNIVEMVARHLQPNHVVVGTKYFTAKLIPGRIALSHFPPTLTDAHGTFHKPPAW